MEKFGANLTCVGQNITGCLPDLLNKIDLFSTEGIFSDERGIICDGLNEEKRQRNINFSCTPNVTEDTWWELTDKSDFKRIMDKFNLYLTPMIIVIGVVGNILSFVVFSVSHLRRNSSSIYLASLALVDTGFLLSLLIVWLDKVDIPMFHQRGWCQLVVYTTHVCPFLSVWNVVGFTAERYVIVWHPLRKDRFCTPKKTKIIVGILTLMGLVMYSFTSWTSGIMTINGGRPICMPYPQFYDALTIFTSVDALVTLLLPSVIIVVLNIRILIRIQYIQKRMILNHKAVSLILNEKSLAKRSTLRASISNKGSMHFKFNNMSVSGAEVTYLPPPDATDMTSQRRSTVAFKGRSQYRLARMLLVVSSIFVLLNIPSHYFKIQAFMQHLFGYSYKSSKHELHWHEFFQLIYYLNFAINFFIYSLCGRPFRAGLKYVLVCLRHNINMQCSRKTPSNENKPSYVL